MGLFLQLNFGYRSFEIIVNSYTMCVMEPQDGPQGDYSTRLPLHQDRVRTTKTKNPLSTQESPWRRSSTQVVGQRIELII